MQQIHCIKICGGGGTITIIKEIGKNTVWANDFNTASSIYGKSWENYKLFI